MAEQDPKEFIAAFRPYLSEALRVVRPGWRLILESKPIRTLLQTTWAKLATTLLRSGVTLELLQENGPDHYLIPKLDRIFAAFSYSDPQNIVCVIVGQDPYPDPNNAEGICFSAAGQKPPPSLRSIYQCLQHHGLVTDLPTTADLSSWARQGILMLNRYLTRGQNLETNDLLHHIWAEFSLAVVQHLATEFPKIMNHHPHYLGVLLWGGVAQQIAEKLSSHKTESYTLEVLRHGHPSPLNKTNNDLENPAAFRNCTHFVHLNRELEQRGLPTINWNPAATITNARISQFFLASKLGQVPDITLLSDLLQKHIVYEDGTSTTQNQEIKRLTKILKETKPAESIMESTPPIPLPPLRELPTTGARYLVAAVDGSCKNNGPRSTGATFACHIPETFLGKPNLLYLTEQSVSGAVPERRLVITKDFQLRTTDVDIKSTNNRGELLGMIHGLLAILRSPYLAPAIIITDSTYAMNLVNESLWRKMLRTKNWQSLVDKNLDLVEIIRVLLLALVERRFDNIDPRRTRTCWELLLQPAARTYIGHPAPMDLEWEQLTLIHQKSHGKAVSVTELQKECEQLNTVADTQTKLTDTSCKQIQIDSSARTPTKPKKS